MNAALKLRLDIFKRAGSIMFVHKNPASKLLLRRFATLGQFRPLARHFLLDARLLLWCHVDLGRLVLFLFALEVRHVLGFETVQVV